MTIKNNYNSVVLLPQQYEFMLNNDPEVLYSGSVGAGKTRSLCYKAAWIASHQGALALLCRQNYSDMVHTTLRTLTKEENGFDGVLPPVLPLGSYEWNKTEKKIHIKGGGDIIYMGFDSALKISSLNLTWAGIDESIEVSPESYFMLKARLRVEIKGVPCQLCSVSNPGSQASFLYMRFINPKTRVKDAKIIYANTEQNFFLPENYLKKQLASITGLQKRRLVKGEWCSAEGAVFDKWDTYYITKEDPSTFKYIVAGVDWGFKHKSAIMVVGLNEDNESIRILDEYTCSGEYSEEVVEMADQLQKKWNIDEFYYDHSNAELGKKLENAGLVTKKANKDIGLGLAIMNNYIRWKDHKRMMTVSPRCTEFIQEISGYAYDKKTQKPVKINDDCMDASRYAIMGIHDMLKYMVSPIILPALY